LSKPVVRGETLALSRVWLAVLVKQASRVPTLTTTTDRTWPGVQDLNMKHARRDHRRAKRTTRLEEREEEGAKDTKYP